ncbi:MAG: vitamin B12-dependent ribonucleotide reductase, partial [Myxococcales bacterium]
GVPLQVLVDKFVHTRFEPSGFTQHPQIPIAKSVADYIFRWLALKFLPKDEGAAAGQRVEEKAGEKQAAPVRTEAEGAYVNQADAPPCHACGSIMVRSGACYKCVNCGATSGCS